MPKNTLRKKHKLCHKIWISKLFTQGKSVSLFPLRVWYLPVSVNLFPHHQVLWSIPKKKIKLAVQRNKIKRQLKEAYRKHQHLLSPLNKTTSGRFLIGYVYVDTVTKPAFQCLEHQVVDSLKYLQQIHLS